MKILYVQPFGLNDTTLFDSSFIVDVFPFPQLNFSSQETDDFNIDIFISSKIVKELEKREFDAVFIPVSLTENYLEFVGMRLAYHIRLSHSLEMKRFVPIIFISDESLFELLRLNDLAKVIVTNGCYLVRADVTIVTKVVQRLFSGNLPGINKSEFKTAFIDRINIEAPANYQSHHAIANEWSILRWAKILGMDEHDPSISTIKENIEGLLFYKFLLTKYPIEIEADASKFKIQGEGKILYIDDEWEKGWNVVLKNFFDLSPQFNYNLKVLQNTFKDKLADQIVTACVDEINSFTPDIILLDLRLGDGDFEEGKLPKDLIGFKVLKKIKEINPGFQVIIFSASNKVWNLLELQEAGANGYFLKESPELSVSKGYAKESIVKFSKQIENCLADAYLKTIYTSISSINTLFSKNPLLKYFPNGLIKLRGLSYQNIILDELKVLWEILQSKNSNKYYLGLLTEFKILECIVEIFIIEKDTNGKWKFWDGSDVLYAKYEGASNSYALVPKTADVKDEAYNSIENRLHSLMIAKLSITNNQIHTAIHAITSYRNKYIHPSDRLSLVSPTRHQINDWLHFINVIISKL